MHSLASPDFIEPEDPFWTGLTGILNSAGVPASEVAPVGAVLTSLFSGFLLAEVNGTLGRLAAMRPTPTGRDRPLHRAQARRRDSSFAFAVQTLIAGLEAHLRPQPPADLHLCPVTSSVGPGRPDGDQGEGSGVSSPALYAAGVFPSLPPEPGRFMHCDPGSALQP